MNQFWQYAKHHQERSIYQFDTDRLLNNLQLWADQFPGIQPYYAVKCNNHPKLIQILYQHHFAFDCASQNELQLVQSVGVQIGGHQPSFRGVMTESIPAVVYANPFKFPTHLQFAEQHGVKMMTADCPEELDKIKRYCPSARVLLRIAVDDSHSICQFNSKFGMVPTEVNLKAFLTRAQDLQVSVVGVSFHVGSGCLSAESYLDALRKCRYVFDFAKETVGLDLNIIDLGGGFMQGEPLLSTVSHVISQQLKQLFNWTPKSHHLYVMAEPGRFMATNVFDLYVQVIGKNSTLGASNERLGASNERLGASDGRKDVCIKYYINNSVYGAFNCKIFDYAVFNYQLYHADGSPITSTIAIPCTVFGSTCDSIDKILEHISLPEMIVGDYMCFKNMGAYTYSASCTFNGIPLADVYQMEKSDQVKELIDS